MFPFANWQYLARKFQHQKLLAIVILTGVICSAEKSSLNERKIERRKKACNANDSERERENQLNAAAAAAA